MTTLLFNLSGLLLIAFIVWWFFLAKPKAKKVVNDTIDIIVKDGIYSPALIEAKQGSMLHLRFIREDTTPCSEIVVFDDFDVSAELPVNTPYEITLNLKEKGEFDFTCQMQMYRGKLVVV